MIIQDLSSLFQIILIDISLAGDNALAVGLAAAGLPAKDRAKAVFIGICAATVLRILFALFAVQILHITGLLIAGGLLLLWVASKMARDILRAKENLKTKEAIPHKTLSAAVWQIALADISMSLDNVLAVTGVARERIIVLVIGLLLSVFLMGAASSLVAKLTTRFPAIAYLGLGIVTFTAFHMMWDGYQAIAHH